MHQRLKEKKSGCLSRNSVLHTSSTWDRCCTSPRPRVRHLPEVRPPASCRKPSHLPALSGCWSPSSPTGQTLLPSQPIEGKCMVHGPSRATIHVPWGIPTPTGEDLCRGQRCSSDRIQFVTADHLLQLLLGRRKPVPKLIKIQLTCFISISLRFNVTKQLPF